MSYGIDKKSPEYVVCLCRGTTRQDVIDFIKESGVKSLRDLCEKMPVGDRCGGCREDLDSILAEVLAEAEHTEASPAPEFWEK